MKGISTIYLTGMLTNLAARLMGRSRRKGKPVRHSALLATAWVVYVVGALVAAVDLPRNLLLTLVLPVALILGVATISEIAFRPRSR